MALVIKDRIKETSTTTGTGTLTLAGASTGFKAFSEIGSGNTTYYAISDGTDWEVGLGTVGSGTLSRDTILASSNSGLAVSWNSDIKDVFCTYPAEKAVYLDASGNFNISDGDIKFGDNDKAIFGAGSDLQIYHTGAHSYIDDQGTGNLYLNSNGSGTIIQGGGTQARFFNGAGVDLWYNNSAKLATTSTGIDVTGTVTADGLTVDAAVATITNADINNGATLRLDNATSSSSWAAGSIIGTLEYYLSADASTTEPVRAKIELEELAGSTYPSQAALNFYTADGNGLDKNMSISSGGDISFYEDTGTTPKFFWDASTERLGIGTSSPTAALDVRRVDASGVIAELHQSAGFGIDVGSSQTEGYISTGYLQDFLFKTNSGSGQIERMRIDSSGNVGIGTTSPAYGITLEGTGAKSSIRVADTTNSVNVDVRADSTGALFRTASNHPVVFATNQIERMRIDSSGNVGIGTTPAGYLTSGYVLRLNGSSAQTYLAFNNSTYTTQVTGGFVIGMDNASANIIQRENLPIKVYTNDTERMRIDTSGNLLVGDTTGSVYDSSSETGLNFTNNGRIYAAASGNSTAILNRIGTDGDLVQFRKDGTTVGSIGAQSGSAYIQGNANSSGFLFGDANIYPWDAGALADNAVTFGTSGQRFKDLYLSGGVYLGGTGSANYLDDYEEGTWVPTASTGMTFHNAACTYTKVGRLVTLHITITMQGSSNNTNQVAILGLPFTSAGTYRTDGVPWMDFFACGDDDGIPHAGITAGRTQIDHWVPRSNTLGNQLTLLPNMMNSGNHTEYQLCITYLTT